MLLSGMPYAVWLYFRYKKWVKPYVHLSSVFIQVVKNVFVNTDARENSEVWEVHCGKQNIV